FTRDRADAIGSCSHRGGASIRRGGLSLDSQPLHLTEGHTREEHFAVAGVEANPGDARLLREGFAVPQAPASVAQRDDAAGHVVREDIAPARSGEALAAIDDASRDGETDGARVLVDGIEGLAALRFRIASGSRGEGVKGLAIGPSVVASANNQIDFLE